MPHGSKIVFALLCAATPSLVVAQAATTNNPGGMPNGPQTRPLGMGENDFASNPSVQDQINRAVTNAPNRGAADAAQGHVRTRPAKPEELVIGSAVRDRKGIAVGTIGIVDSEGAVVETATGKVKVPLDAFGIDKKGIVIGITKAEFDSLVTRATSSPAG